MEGAEYKASRKAANAANRALHAADPSLAEQHVHEIQPIKFGGSPTDLANKALNLAAMNRAVGHFGTCDYQRVGNPASFIFYSGYTPVSNVDVGGYLFGAGFSESVAGAISNTFASLFSKNAGDPNQQIYRNLGYEMAAGKGNYACSASHQ